MAESPRFTTPPAIPAVDEAALRASLAQAVAAVRAENPLAPSITNTVTQNFVANAQLAVGGSAAMVYLPDEGEQVAAMGGAVYLNLGTLLPIYEQTIPRTARACAEADTPWVLDPVGLGIGQLRTELLQAVRATPPAIVRGNASEIIGLAKLWGLGSDRTADKAADSTNDATTATANGDDAVTAQEPSRSATEADRRTTANGPRGVDTTDEVDAARAAAAALARFIGGAVAVSGPVDLVTDGAIVARAPGGSPLMCSVTGSGCSLGGVAAVYACVTDPFTAALTATVLYNLAGARAAEHCAGPGSFQVVFLDELHRATPEDVAAAPMTFERPLGETASC